MDPLPSALPRACANWSGEINHAGARSRSVVSMMPTALCECAENLTSDILARSNTFADMRRAIALVLFIEFSAPGWIKKVEQLAPALPKRYKRIRNLCIYLDIYKEHFDKALSAK